MSNLRKSPRKIVRAIMETLSSNDQKTVEAIAQDIDSGWKTTLSYLELIEWVQSCPRVVRIKVTKNIDVWKREYGRLPS
jgi:hypothetical protein